MPGMPLQIGNCKTESRSRREMNRHAIVNVQPDPSVHFASVYGKD